MTFQPLNGQKLCPFASLRFGWRRIAHNGCGLLAIYNALGLLGQEVDFLRLHQQLHSWYQPRFFGLFPWRIRRFFRKQGLPFQRTKHSEQIASLLQNGGVAVVTYWNRVLFSRVPNPFGGAHTITIRYDGAWTVYNRYSNRERSYRLDTLQELLEGRKLMQALCFKK